MLEEVHSTRDEPGCDLRSLLLQAFGRSPLGVCHLDPAHVIAWANTTFAHYVGIPLDRLLFQSGEAVIHGWSSHLRDQAEEARKTGTAVQVAEYPHLFPDQPDRGTTFWSSWITPLSNRDGAFQGYLLVLDEVTAQVRREREIEELLAVTQEQNEKLGEQGQFLADQNQRLQAQSSRLRAQSEELQAQVEEIQSQHEELQAQQQELRATNALLVQAQRTLSVSEERLRCLFDYSPIGIGTYRNGIIIDANPAAVRMLGYDDRSDLVGTPVPNVVAPSHRVEIAERMRRRELGETVPSAYETVGQRKNGSLFPLFLEAARMALPDGMATVVYFTDISERKGIQEALQKAHDEFELRVRERTAELAQSNEELRLAMLERREC